jgi:hypothetical protein
MKAAAKPAGRKSSPAQAWSRAIELTAPIADRMYLPTPVVFTTGILDASDHYIVASGEADLACRITHIEKARFV